MRTPERARASVENLSAVSRLLSNATSLPGPFPEPAPAPLRSARPRLERLFPFLTVASNPHTPSRSACPGGFSEQRGRAAALTFSSSRAHQREEAAARLLCDRSERTVKMDAKPRRCHYAHSPPPLRTAPALPQSPWKRPFLEDPARPPSVNWPILILRHERPNQVSPASFQGTGFPSGSRGGRAPRIGLRRRKWGGTLLWR
ncbi:hypothetical protein H8959_022460 [Pygathrix nigripes]